MTLSLAINGFGRIGRMTLRAWLESARDDVSIRVVNDGSTKPAPSAEEACHLLRYDSLHGRLPLPLAAERGNILRCGDKQVEFFASSGKPLDWGSLGVDIVLDCSGAYRTRARAEQHLQKGAPKVLVSAPCEGADASVVFGVNHTTLRSEHRIVSALSCTTNCLAPIAYVLQELCGIERGFATTCHAYTPDQHLHDKWHSDLRRARAACLSIVPTSTGAAKAIALTLPQLKGKIISNALRVPTATVSMLVLSFVAERETSLEAILAEMRSYAQGAMKGVLALCDEPLVSVDFVHRAESSILDTPESRALDSKAFQLTAWYDNEWGFSNRMLDLAALMGK